MSAGKKVDSSVIRRDWFESEVPAETKRASAYWGRRVGLGEDEKKDCESDTNIVVYQRIAEGRLTEKREGGWKAYVWGIANVYAMRIRFRGSRRREKLPAAGVDPESVPGANDPSLAVEVDELVWRLRLSIPKLEKNRRYVVCRRYFANKTLLTIAKETGRSVAWVHGKKQDALDDLRRMVG